MVLVVPATRPFSCFLPPAVWETQGSGHQPTCPAKSSSASPTSTTGDSCIEELAKVCMLYSTCHPVFQNQRESGVQLCPTYVTWLPGVDTLPSRIIFIL